MVGRGIMHICTIKDWKYIWVICTWD